MPLVSGQMATSTQDYDSQQGSLTTHHTALWFRPGIYNVFTLPTGHIP